MRNPTAGDPGDRMPEAGPAALADGPLAGLTYGKAAFRLRAQQDAQLPPFLGSTLRGGLGHALRRIACLPLCRTPDTCILRERCAYAVCFETTLPKGATRLRGYERIPHPFLLEPPTENDGRWAEGADLEFGLVLVGRAVSHFPFLVAAVHQMAEEGLGVRRNRLRLQEVVSRTSGPAPEDGQAPETAGAVLWRGTEDAIRALPVARIAAGPEGPVATSARPAAGPARVALRFDTPTRLTEDGRVTHEIRFRLLARAVLARLSSLMYFHCGRELKVDFKGILDRCEAVRTTDARLAVHDLARWSNRQKATIPLDGVVGAVAFEGPAVAEMLPFLRAGEVLHVGKGTVFGLGKYEIESVDGTGG